MRNDMSVLVSELRPAGFAAGRRRSGEFLLASLGEEVDDFDDDDFDDEFDDDFEEEWDDLGESDDDFADDEEDELDEFEDE